MEAIKEEARIDLTKIHDTIQIPKIPPWTITTPKVILTLCKLQKTKTHPLTFQEELVKIKDKYPRHSHIFMGCSKQEKTTGCAAVYNGKKKTVKKHLPNYTSIFNAEMCSVDMVLNLIQKSKKSLFFLTRCRC